MTVKPDTQRALSAEQRERFERDGYLVVDSICQPELLDAILADVNPRYRDLEEQEKQDEGGVLYTRNRIMDAWRISENVKALATAPTVLSILEQLYGRKPLPFQTLNFPLGTQQAAHSDAIHFSSMPPGYMAGVWVALEDIDMDNGPLVYYPGSQKRPYMTMQDLGVEAHASQYPHYVKHVKELIAREGMEPQYGTIRKGEALIWSANLLHGGAPQRDMSRTRHSQVTHYYFEGCKYYTPMTSGPDEIAWRDPEWIA